MDSMECYALQNNYTYLRLIGADFKEICEQNHINFQRHCIVAHILKSYNFTWVLHVDADVGVVNERRRLEEYIKEDLDIIFHERFFNFEVGAASYFARKSDFSKIFLRGWADYSFRLPQHFHSDNAALHMWLVELFAPNAPFTPPAGHYGKEEVLRNATLSRVFIYRKGEGWLRDSWLTNSHWSPEIDFMFHHRKEKWKKQFNVTQIKVLQGPRFDWCDTLTSPLDLDKCRRERRRKDVEELRRDHLQFLYKFASRLTRTWSDEDVQDTK
ncbi:unnamed protein product [Cylicocyclus nassatus]|uniref:Uncharacterized protein n=1 Tax=Cylicocyclus nassatus TaxID=53992 RepID=A0AA36GK11_CYLNA|nr:unnamed protein product [Cylicocyclus nassatus]